MASIFLQNFLNLAYKAYSLDCFMIIETLFASSYLSSSMPSKFSSNIAKNKLRKIITPMSTSETKKNIDI